MNYPWQYDETVQVGADFRDQQEISAYDERTRKMRNIGAEVKPSGKLWRYPPIRLSGKGVGQVNF